MFQGNLDVRDVGGGYWRLISPLVWVVRGLGSGCLEVVVPEGFETNFASTPRFLWSLIPPTGRWNRAAVIHDYLYTASISRFLADSLFREAMRQLGVPWWRRVPMYLGVRMFGGSAYGSLQRRREDETARLESGES